MASGTAVVAMAADTAGAVPGPALSAPLRAAAAALFHPRSAGVTASAQCTLPAHGAQAAVFPAFAEPLVMWACAALSLAVAAAIAMSVRTPGPSSVPSRDVKCRRGRAATPLAVLLALGCLHVVGASQHWVRSEDGSIAAVTGSGDPVVARDGEAGIGLGGVGGAAAFGTVQPEAAGADDKSGRGFGAAAVDAIASAFGGGSSQAPAATRDDDPSTDAEADELLKRAFQGGYSAFEPFDEARELEKANIRAAAETAAVEAEERARELERQRADEQRAAEQAAATSHGNRVGVTQGPMGPSVSASGRGTGAGRIDDLLHKLQEASDDVEAALDKLAFNLEGIDLNTIASLLKEQKTGGVSGSDGRADLVVTTTGAEQELAEVVHMGDSEAGDNSMEALRILRDAIQAAGYTTPVQAQAVDDEEAVALATVTGAGISAHEFYEGHMMVDVFTAFDYLEGIRQREKHPWFQEVEIVSLFTAQGGVAAVRAQLEASVVAVHHASLEAWPMWSQLGNTWRATGDVNRAIQCFRKALSIKPTDPDVLLNLAVVMQNLGYLDDAELLIREAVSLHPNGVLHHFILGNILDQVGNLPEAMASYETALQLQPSFAPCERRLKALQDLGVLSANASLLSRVMATMTAYAGLFIGGAMMLLGHRLRKAVQQESASTARAKAVGEAVRGRRNSAGSGARGAGGGGGGGRKGKR